MTQELHSVFRQLNDLLGSGQPVRELLKSILEREPRCDITLGANKEETIQNLRAAVERGIGELFEVQSLLWDLEEVGRQHILLLKPAPDELSPNTHDLVHGYEVAAALFDEEPVENLFPRYEYPTGGYMWADFRHIGDNGGWIAKAYGREMYRQSLGAPTTEEQEDGTIQEVRRYAWKEVKATLLARWRPQADILELRVDISSLQNEKTVDERREQLWTLLKPAFKPRDLIGVDIDSLLNRLVFDRESEENQLRYSMSRLELTDPRSGLVRVIPNQAEAFDNDQGRKASLAAMQANDFRPSLVRIDWKNCADGCPKCMTEPVSVVLEKTGNGPELRILKRISNETYEYIFDQLRSRL